MTRAAPRRRARSAGSALLAACLAFVACDGADSGRDGERAEGGEVEIASGSAPTGGGAASTASVSKDPTLGGSAPIGASGGLAILEPSDLARPFFRDFGGVPKGETRLWTIRLLNQDPGPVEVGDTIVPCACMRVKSLTAIPEEGEPIAGNPYAEAPPLLVVPAGAVLEIVLELSTEKLTANSDKLALFRLRTSSPASPNVTFEAHIKALSSFTVFPAELQFKEVPEGYGGREKVRILAEPRGSGAKVLRIEQQGEHVTGTLEETFYGGEHVWHLLADIPPLTPQGGIRDSIVLATTDERGEGDAGRLVVPVFARIVPDVRIDPPLLSLGLVPAGETKSVTGALECLVPGVRTRIVGHRFEGEGKEHLTFESEPVQPDDDGRATAFRLRVTAGPGLPRGPIAARLHVELDDPQNPSASVPVSGAVR